LTVVDNAQGVALTQKNVDYSEGLVLEDAEDGTTTGWTIYDNDPVGSTVTNEYDTTRQSKVIAFLGSGTSNGYSLSKNDGASLQITDKFTISFSLKSSENYTIYIQVSTSAGLRYLTYSNEDTDRLGTSSYIYYGLGKVSADGAWKNFTRNLQNDIIKAQPNVSLTSVDKILIRGSIKIDDIIFN
jgi:hypothetical protein